jgi:hypothetical protein
MTDFRSLIHALVDARVEFILVGGVAATVHGATRLTLDVDASTGAGARTSSGSPRRLRLTILICVAPRRDCHSTGTRQPSSTG